MQTSHIRASRALHHLTRRVRILHHMLSTRMIGRRLLPVEVKGALIEVCGRTFYYKKPLFDMFARAGIKDDMYLQYEHEPKFKIIRQLLGDLEGMGDDGFHLQRRLLTEICKLRGLADNEVPDRDSGLDALRNLKRVVHEHDIDVDEERTVATKRAVQTQQIAQEESERERRISELHRVFVALTNNDNPQARGYGLEDILKELFAIYEIRYRKSYRSDGEQIDGFFSFGGFDYLVEARWRKTQPTLNDLLAFKGKVDRKIESTRGVVISLSGFRNDVVGHLRQAGPTNLVLIDGYDLNLVLDGRVSLVDALQHKTDVAAQEGVVYFSLAQLF